MFVGQMDCFHHDLIQFAVGPGPAGASKVANVRVNSWLVCVFKEAIS